MALISLEDLDGLDDAQLDDDITDNPEPMDEEDRDRLLTHWQAVASTHHVSVPPDMTGPIQEMTHNNQQREPLPFTPITSHEKDVLRIDHRGDADSSDRPSVGDSGRWRRPPQRRLHGRRLREPETQE